ncbi:unnamed protein product [Cuscuta epithymum]|uniref:RRM domain-containing protein n=1 Tax=Cuscuta epithymum TaxID=186058 RepID=A0AAV0DVR9_9ASTE|nr:unnamed protein product [Cuscuta epithymum]
MSLTSSITPLFATTRFSAKSSALHFQFAISNSCRSSNIVLSFSSSSYGFCCRAIPTTSTPSPYGAPTKAHQHWMVLVEPPPQGFTSRSQIINYYVKTLERVLGSERDAQMCIYASSYEANFGFYCDITEEEAQKLAGLPNVLSVKHDPCYNSNEKDYSLPSSLSNMGSSLLFPIGTSKRWCVRTSRPAVEVSGKAPLVDYYVQILAEVLRNEKDAQMCLYHVLWGSEYGFCCELDEECAQELAAVPGILSVHPDDEFVSDKEDYKGGSSKYIDDSKDSSTSNVKTKKLFVTGLSFYTSEKTLRAAFEGYGKLVEVKIIVDKISKRSKGYGFLEYTTEEAATAALNQMNGRIINGWMITVDVAKKNPPKYNRGSSGLVS